jgi:hypothetical protein
MMRKFGLSCIVATLAVVLLCSPASAILYTGAISGTDGTLFYSPAMSWSGAVLSWDVDYDGSSKLWTYNYTFATNNTKAISHLILEVSEDFGSRNIFPGTTGGYEKDNPKLHGESGNPGIPGTIWGIKWETAGDPLTYSFTIVTDRGPMWGDFYAKDGVDGPGLYVYAYNKGFGWDTSAPIADGNAGGWVLVPDTTNGISEPGILLLLGTGLVGLAAVTRRKMK